MRRCGLMCVCARAHRRHSTTNVWMKIIHKVLRTDAACLPGSQRNSLNGTKWVHRKNKPIRLSKRRAVALSLYMVFMRTTVWIVCDVCANDRATIAFQWKLFVYLWVWLVHSLRLPLKSRTVNMLYCVPIGFSHNTIFVRFRCDGFYRRNTISVSTPFVTLYKFLSLCISKMMCTLSLAPIAKSCGGRDSGGGNGQRHKWKIH